MNMKKIIMSLAFALGVSVGVQAADKPQYPGGQEALDQYLTANLKYPEMARENGVEGVVDVKFTVKADGTIGNIKIARMVDPDLESEAIRLVKNMPKWQPADKDGQAIDAPASVKVNFVIPES